jgi:hypothetical protein
MAAVTRLEPGAPPLRTANLSRLESLAGALTARGLHADVVALPGRIPRLEVASPSLRTTEDVYAWRCQDGTWWYWWSWAERIAAGDALELAAERIVSALTPS